MRCLRKLYLLGRTEEEVEKNPTKLFHFHLKPVKNNMCTLFSNYFLVYDYLFLVRN